MKINRRDFLKWSVAATVALKLELDLDGFNGVMAAETDPPIIWLHGASCSGCSISTLNVTNPGNIDDILMNKLSMKFNSLLMGQCGEKAIIALDEAANIYNGQFILVIEGAIPTAEKGNYCILGELNGVPLNMLQAVNKYGPMAKYVVSAGTCASFGGVAKAAPNKGVCVTPKDLLNGKTKNTVINLPGCPVHPTVLIQTLLELILTGTQTLDTNNRPKKFYGSSIHSKCQRRSNNEVSSIGVVGCYKKIGCKGPSTQNVCPSYLWNNGVAWCIGVNQVCIGCASSSFPASPLVKM